MIEALIRDLNKAEQDPPAEDVSCAMARFESWALAHKAHELCGILRAVCDLSNVDFNKRIVVLVVVVLLLLLLLLLLDILMNTRSRFSEID